jgi:hypothetical protein
MPGVAGSSPAWSTTSPREIRHLRRVPVRRSASIFSKAASSLVRLLRHRGSIGCGGCELVTGVGMADAYASAYTYTAPTLGGCFGRGVLPGKGATETEVSCPAGASNATLTIK